MATLIPPKKRKPCAAAARFCPFEIRCGNVCVNFLVFREGLVIHIATIRMGLALVVTAFSFAVSGQPVAGTMDAWAWKHRVVVVFAPDSRDGSLSRQREAFAGTEAAIADRHMSVIEVVDGQATAVMGAPINVHGHEMKKFLHKKDASFEVFLLGKDTGVKLRSATPVTSDDLFSLIDSMPMRQREMDEGSTHES